MTRADDAPEARRVDFDQVVAEQYEAVRRVVFRLLGWTGGGEDVVQDVFLAAWVAWPKFRGDASVALWLKRIAVNQCRTRLRWQGVRERWLSRRRRGARHEPPATVDDISADGERKRRVREAIRSLPRRYREVTVLHYLEQLGAEQIAKVLGARRGTVDVWLHRARRKLKDALADLAE